MECERIESEGELIAFLVRKSFEPKWTTFVTPDEANLQVGFIVKEADDEVPAHDHKPLLRSIVGTAEVLIVKQGSGEVEFFDSKRKRVTSLSFGAGDVLVLLAGGHGFKFDEETTLIEVKQGPYPGIDEKERFDS